MRIIFSLAVSLCLTLPAWAEKITIVADEWCPYNCEANSDKPGFMVELAREIFSKHGIEVEYNIVPWKRAVEGTIKGDYDGVICIAKAEGGKEILYPQNYQALSQYEIYILKDSEWKFRGIYSLKDVRLGIIADYSYGNLDDYIEKNKLDNTKIQIATTDNATQVNLKKLLSGRVTAIIEDRYVMAYLLNKNGLKEKVISAGLTHPIPIPDTDYLYIGFSPKTSNGKKYSKILSDGTVEMQENGRFKAIKEKYGIREN